MKFLLISAIAFATVGVVAPWNSFSEPSRSSLSDAPSYASYDNQVLPVSDRTTDRTTDRTRAQPNLTRDRSSVQIAQEVDARSAWLMNENPNARINIRSAPTTSATVVHIGRVGDRLVILDETPRDDGYMWYLVRLADANVEGWVRGDLVSREVPIAPTRSSDSSIASIDPDARQETGSRREIATMGQFTSEEINYFLEIALGSENGSYSPNIRKWRDEIRIQIMTSHPDGDDAVVQDVIDDLNELIGGTPTLVLVDSNPNVELYFLPLEEFSEFDPSLRRGQIGAAWIEEDDYVIHHAKILIGSSHLTNDERAHIIREEITQSLGIMRDSWSYPGSIFYQGWTRTQRFDSIDETMIRMLYNSAIELGMNAEEVEQVLTHL